MDIATEMVLMCPYSPEIPYCHRVEDEPRKNLRTGKLTRPGIEPGYDRLEAMINHSCDLKLLLFWYVVVNTARVPGECRLVICKKMDLKKCLAPLRVKSKLCRHPLPSCCHAIIQLCAGCLPVSNTVGPGPTSTITDKFTLNNTNVFSIHFLSYSPHFCLFFNYDTLYLLKKNNGH